jgi:hypothetical protein
VSKDRMKAQPHDAIPVSEYLQAIRRVSTSEAPRVLAKLFGQEVPVSSTRISRAAEQLDAGSVVSYRLHLTHTIVVLAVIRLMSARDCAIARGAWRADKRRRRSSYLLLPSRYGSSNGCRLGLGSFWQHAGLPDASRARQASQLMSGVGCGCRASSEALSLPERTRRSALSRA